MISRTLVIFGYSQSQFRRLTQEATQPIFSVVWPNEVIGHYMRNQQTDPRLDAANLTQEDFIGEMEYSGDASPADALVEALQNMNQRTKLHEHQLLEPRDGYVLRYNVPSDSHCVYLLYNNKMVGFFHETDSLVIHSEHQGKGLGKELVLAAFAQKPWKNPQRKVTSAGKRTLKSAYRFACQAVKIDAFNCNK